MSSCDDCRSTSPVKGFAAWLHQRWLEYGPSLTSVQRACVDARQVLTDMIADIGVVDAPDIYVSCLGVPSCSARDILRKRPRALSCSLCRWRPTLGAAIRDFRPEYANRILIRLRSCSRPPAGMPTLSCLAFMTPRPPSTHWSTARWWMSRPPSRGQQGPSYAWTRLPTDARLTWQLCGKSCAPELRALKTHLDNIPEDLEELKRVTRVLGGRGTPLCARAPIVTRAPLPLLVPLTLAHDHRSLPCTPPATLATQPDM